MKALIVMAHPVPDHMATWREVHGLGCELHVAGTLMGQSTEAFQPEPADLTFAELHAFKPRGPTRPGQLWWVYPGLRRLIRALKPDLVHVSNEAWGLLSTQALGSGFPTVLHGADNQFRFGPAWESGIRTAVARRNLHRAAGYVSWNSAGLRLAEEHGLGPGSPTLVAPFLSPDPEIVRFDAERRERVRRDLGLSGEIVGFVGRLTSAKGPDLLIDAVARTDTRPTVILAGDGPLRRDLESQADALKVDCRFLGQVGNAEVPGLLSAADVVAVPSRTTPEWCEQFGRIAVEAMFAERSVVASDSGALPEVVGNGGSLFRQADAASLARVLDTALAGSKSVIQVSRARTEALSRYAPEVLARGVVDLWSDCLGVA